MSSSQFARRAWLWQKYCWRPILRQLSASQRLCAADGLSNVKTLGSYGTGISEEGHSLGSSRWESRMCRVPLPDYDWDYLCDPDNTMSIQENIKQRKGIGDIHKVVGIS